MTFRLQGLPFAEPSFGTLERQTPSTDGARGDEASWPVVSHGMLYRMTTAEFRHLQQTEGGAGHKGTGYDVEEVDVEVYGGDVQRLIEEEAQLAKTATDKAAAAHNARLVTVHPGGKRATVRARALVAASHCIQHRPVATSRRYQGLVSRGARDMGLNDAYCRFLEEEPCHDKRVAFKPLWWLGLLLFLSTLIPVGACIKLWPVVTGRRPAPRPLCECSSLGSFAVQ